MDYEENNTLLLHKIDQVDTNSFFSRKVVIFLVIISFLGIGSGYFLAKNVKTLGPINTSKLGISSSPKGTVVGSNDLKTFKDTTEGVLEKGGIDGEGQFHLRRPGGESQNVYLTSSVVDLSKFISRKIKVWGETQKAQKAGWLMDAGRVEVLE